MIAPRRRTNLSLLLALVVPVAALACRQVLGIESDAPLAGDVEGGTPDDSSTPDVGTGAKDGGHADADGGASDAALCGDVCPIEILAGDLGQSTYLAVDGQNVYFADEGAAIGSVSQCPKAGCKGKPVLLGEGYATGIAFDATRVYWNDPSGDKVMACTIGGCANAPTSIAGTQVSAKALAGDGTSLAWASNGSIRTCAAGNCASPKTLAQNQTGFSGLSVDSSIVYWTNDTADGGVFSCAAAGCTTPTRIGTGTGVVTAKNGLTFWVAGNGIVSCSSPTCPTPKTIGASTRPVGLVTDGTYVYWRDVLEQKVLRCHRDGCTGAAEVLAKNQPGAPGTNLAIDGEYVYWTNQAQVLRRHK